MWPRAEMIEPEPVLAELGPVGTITRTDELSARTKAGSRPPDGFGCSGGVVGLAGATVGVGTDGLAGGSVGFGAGVELAAIATGLLTGVAAVVGVAAATLTVGVGVARLSATARRTSTPVPNIA